MKTVSNFNGGSSLGRLGFANFGSLGILIGGLKSMAPERSSEILSLGFKSILSGTLATLLTGSIAGILI